jgi:hypothetical protein
LLTGILVSSGSWLLFKTIWFTVLVSIPVLVWMGFFLLLYPQLVLHSDILKVDSNPNRDISATPIKRDIV